MKNLDVTSSVAAVLWHMYPKWCTPTNVANTTVPPLNSYTVQVSIRKATQMNEVSSFDFLPETSVSPVMVCTA